MLSTMASSGDARRIGLLQGTVDLVVLRTLHTMGPQHAYAIAARIEQIAEQPAMMNQGTLYPALVRLEQKGWIKATWRTTENNREASSTPSRNPASASSASRSIAGSAPSGSSTSCW